MKTMKRLLSSLLVISMLCSLCIMPLPASALSAASKETLAKSLFELGLFKGYDETGTSFALADIPTREHALVFLIRMLGQDNAALAWIGPAPYSDVPDSHWSKPYVGYGVQKKYTVGISDGKFGLGRNVNMQEMAIFILRGLGYSDASDVKDFDWNSCLTLAENLGIISSTTPITPFTRGDAVTMIFNALAVKVKGQNYDLLSKLMSQGAVTQAQYDKALVALGDIGSAVKNVSVSPVSFVLAIGKTKQLTANITPATIASKGVTWTTSDASIAAVDSKGLVTPIKAGNVTITATSLEGGNTGVCTLVITPTTAEKSTTAPFRLYNSTEKSITELYITDSSLPAYDEMDFLNANNYSSFSTGKVINVDIEFFKNTSFDFFIRFADGAEAEATGLSLKDATATGGAITLRTKDVIFAISGITKSTAAYKTAIAAETTAESKQLATRFNAALIRYNGLVDRFNKNTTLSADASLVKALNEVATSVNAMGDMVNQNPILTSAQIADITKSLNEVDSFLNNLEMLLNAAT